VCVLPAPPPPLLPGGGGAPPPPTTFAGQALTGLRGPEVAEPT
jgi:hypothetical protein